MRVSILSILVLSLSQAAFAAPVQDMNLKIRVSQDLLQTHSREEVEAAVAQKFANAEACINQSFAAGGSPIRLSLKTSPIEWMNEDDLSRLSVSPFEPDHLSNGQLWKTVVGTSTRDFTVNFYNVDPNHVPFAFTPEVIKTLQEPSFAALIAAVERGEEPKNVPAADAAKFARLRPGNLIRIGQMELFHAEEKTWNIVPHELMHAIAGYEDNYVNPAHKAPNLMGSYGGGNECVLTKAQIAQFVRSRSAGEVRGK